MYVCLCRGYTDKDIARAAAEAGNDPAATEIYKRLGAPPKCGKCVRFAIDMLRDQGMFLGEEEGSIGEENDLLRNV